MQQTTLRQRRRKERMNRLIHQACLVSFPFLIMLGIIVIIGFENNKLRQQLAEQQQVIEDKESEIYILNLAADSLRNIINDLDEQLEDVSEINKSYVDQINETNEELDTFRNRAELYDKYEYAVTYGGERTQLTYAEIEYGEELMVAKGLNPNLMFGTIMVESNGIPDAVNTVSGATGYGQFLDSTAKFVWTNLLGNDTYYSDIRKDGESNILMMAEYYDYLYDEYNGDTFSVVKCYSGNTTYEGAARYLANVNNFTNTVGAVVN